MRTALIKKNIADIFWNFWKYFYLVCKMRTEMKLCLIYYENLLRNDVKIAVSNFLLYKSENILEKLSEILENWKFFFFYLYLRKKIKIFLGFCKVQEKCLFNFDFKFQAEIRKFCCICLGKFWRHFLSLLRKKFKSRIERKLEQTCKRLQQFNTFFMEKN